MFNVVLVRPEIPSNTGNIGRLCVATHSRLHLVGPLGFDLSDKQLKRAGLDYWPELKYQTYENFNNWNVWYAKQPSSGQCYFFSTKSKNHIYDHEFKRNDFFIFGSETKGLDSSILEKNIDQSFRIPMFASVRSLNLSNAVSIVVYEAMRQTLLKEGSVEGLS